MMMMMIMIMTMIIQLLIIKPRYQQPPKLVNEILLWIMSDISRSSVSLCSGHCMNYTHVISITLLIGTVNCMMKLP